MMTSVMPSMIAATARFVSGNWVMDSPHLTIPSSEVILTRHRLRVALKSLGSGYVTGIGSTLAIIMRLCPSVRDRCGAAGALRKCPSRRMSSHRTAIRCGRFDTAR
jgi:hypothetical protein